MKRWRGSGARSGRGRRGRGVRGAIRGGLDDQAVEARFRAARDPRLRGAGRRSPRADRRDPAARGPGAEAARACAQAPAPAAPAPRDQRPRSVRRDGARRRRRGCSPLAEDRLHGIEEATGRAAHEPRPRPGTTWVTRRGVMVDRIASAWLIRRFIDRAARFKFVGGRGYRPARGEVRFDMAGAEHTHEGERCTFESAARALRAALDRAAGDRRHRPRPRSRGRTLQTAGGERGPTPDRRSRSGKRRGRRAPRARGGGLRQALRLVFATSRERTGGHER